MNDLETRPKVRLRATPTTAWHNLDTVDKPLQEAESRLRHGCGATIVRARGGGSTAAPPTLARRVVGVVGCEWEGVEVGDYYYEPEEDDCD